MKLVQVIFNISFLFVRIPIDAGGVCSTTVKPIPKLTQQELVEQNKQKIAIAVMGMPLEHVLIHYRNGSKHNLNIEDTEGMTWFRKCVIYRFQQHEDEILKMEADSRDKYRSAVMGPQARDKHKARKARRKAMQDRLPPSVTEQLKETQ